MSRKKMCSPSLQQPANHTNRQSEAGRAALRLARAWQCQAPSAAAGRSTQVGNAQTIAWLWWLMFHHVLLIRTTV